MNSVIDKEAKVYNRKGIVSGYVEWEKKIRFYWVRLSDEEVFVEAKKVTING